MKKILLIAAVALLVAGAYLFGSFNSRQVIELPVATWTEDSQSAQAWREFSASLEAGGQRVFEATTDPAERLQGLRYLAQLASVSLEMKLAKGRASEPQFTNWMGDYRKFLGDSPDAVYHTAQLSSAYRYEITGNRGDAEYLGFMLYGRQMNGWNRAAANVSSESMRFGDNGDFTILLSRDRPADHDGNWLQLEEDVHMVMVRQYYHDRASAEESDFSIRNLDQPGYLVAGDTETATAMREASAFFNETLSGAVALSEMLAGAPNQVDPPASYSPDFGGVFYPTFDNSYYGSWFYLQDDEALVIEGAVPDVNYWSVSLQNRWMQSLDYAHHQVSLNNHQIDSEAGRYRVVVAHRQPPSGNWLSTAGHREGLLSIRYQLASDAEPPSFEVVKFETLR